MDIHRSARFIKLIPKRFKEDAYKNGVKEEFANGSKMPGKEHKRRKAREAAWLEDGKQYGKYANILGFNV